MDAFQILEVLAQLACGVPRPEAGDPSQHV